MKEYIIAIIGGASTIIAAVIGIFLTGKKRTKKRNIQKLKKTLPLPKPFPCADICTEDYIQMLEGPEAKFNFVSVTRPDEIPNFVSIVYQYDSPTDISKFKRFDFMIRFGEGDFDKLWLEVHPADTDHFRIRKTLIIRGNGWQKMSLTYEELDINEICGEIKEICFVVNRNHFSQEAQDERNMKGSFEIRDFMIIK